MAFCLAVSITATMRGVSPGGYIVRPVGGYSFAGTMKTMRCSIVLGKLWHCRSRPSPIMFHSEVRAVRLSKRNASVAA
jgi:hypothetical protein